MNTETTYLIFLLLTFVVAVLYSSVGHGGASGYLALMAVFGIAPSMMKSSALMMNVLVSLIAFIHYYRSGNFNRKIFLPFAVTSVPAAFLRGSLHVDENIYNKILCAFLIFPVLRLFGVFGRDAEKKKQINNILAALIGFAIGLLSGMIGIGGGIILSPVLLLLHWANIKETAAVSSLFIFLNSIAGLMGIISTATFINPVVILWVAISLVGGFVGAYAGARKMKNPVLKKILATVLLFASVKLFFTSAK